MVTIAYTDGSCAGPDGQRRAAWAFWVADLVYADYVRNYPATSPVAELAAILMCLRYCIAQGIKQLILYTDSKYAIDSLTGLPGKWQECGWRTTRGTAIANFELLWCCWVELRTIQVEFRHVAGHSGNPYNEIVDRAARTLTKKSPQDNSRV